MKLLLPIAAALLAFSPQAEAQPGPAPASDALVETLLSVLPDRAQLGKIGDPDPAEVEALNALNPGREAQVRTILADFETCIAPAYGEGIRRMIRSAARSLGEAGLKRLIEFYRNDPAVMGPLFERLRGPAPSAADKAEEARLIAAYPLREYAQAFERAKAEAAGDQLFLAAATRCLDARDSAILEAGLKTGQGVEGSD
jgi:hypothetical protein